MFKATGILFIAVVLLVSLAIIPCFGAQFATIEKFGPIPKSSSSFTKVKSISKGVEVTKKTENPVTAETKKTFPEKKGTQYTETGIKQDYTRKTVQNTTTTQDGSKTVRTQTDATYKNADGSTTKATYIKWAKYDKDGNLVKVTGKLSRTTTDKDGTIHKSYRTDNYKIRDNGKAYIDTSVSKYKTVTKEGKKTEREIKTKHEYNAAGERTGASGTETITSTNSKTGKTTKATGSVEYVDKDGKLMLKKETTKGEITDKNGKKITDVSMTKTREFVKAGDTWHIASTKTVNNAASTDGDKQTITRTYTYQRDKNGVCTDIKVAASGTRRETEDNGTVKKYNLDNYSAEVERTATGIEMEDEDYDWKLVS